MPRTIGPALAVHLVLAALLLSGGPRHLGAQATVRGQILQSTSRAPLSAAVVRVARGGLHAVTDSSGRFVFLGLPRGEHRLIASAPGFQPESTEVDVDVDLLEIASIVLRPAAQVLGGVTVTGEASTTSSRISGFEARRKFGNGTFIDRAMLERFDNRQLAEALQAMAPGVSIRRGTSRKAWAATARAPWSSGGAFGSAGGFQLDKSDLAAGARPACYMDVYLDGALVYNSKGSSSGPGTAIPLFDVNSLNPDQIESIEVYASASQVPAQFNRTAAGCGVLVIWTRS